MTRSCNWSSVPLGALGASAGHTFGVAPPGEEKLGHLYAHQPGRLLLLVLLATGQVAAQRGL